MSKDKKTYKCGFVTVVGRPNVGKSTLINTLVDEKISIVSKVPQTTRRQLRGIYNDYRGQIIFVDTPGLHLGKDKLNNLMNQSSTDTFDDADCIIYLVDTKRRLGREEENIAYKLKDIKTPIILGLNKVDNKAADIPLYINFWQKVKGMKVEDMDPDHFRMISLSGLEGINTDKLIDVIYEMLPEGPALYPTDIVCDYPKRLAIADIIREKLFRNMDDEVPHSIGVFVESMRPIKGKTLAVSAVIYVERQKQKEIVIGKGGSMLKRIGTHAREELEELLESKVFLELNVKTKKNWREDVSILTEMGYNDI